MAKTIFNSSKVVEKITPEFYAAFVNSRTVCVSGSSRETTLKSGFCFLHFHHNDENDNYSARIVWVTSPMDFNLTGFVRKLCEENESVIYDFIDQLYTSDKVASTQIDVSCIDPYDDNLVNVTRLTQATQVDINTVLELYDIAVRNCNLKTAVNTAVLPSDYPLEPLVIDGRRRYLNNQMYFVSKYKFDVRRVHSAAKDPMSRFSKATTWPEFNKTKIVLNFKGNSKEEISSDNIFVSSSIDGAINAYCEANGVTGESLYLYCVSCNVINEYAGPMSYVLGCPEIDLDDFNKRSIYNIARIAKVTISGFLDVYPSHAVYTETLEGKKYLLDATRVDTHGTKRGYGWHEVNTRVYSLIPTSARDGDMKPQAGNVIFIPYDEYDK